MLCQYGRPHTHGLGPGRPDRLRARLACRCRQPNVELLSPRNGTSSWRHGASLAGSHGWIVYSTRVCPLVGVTGETFRVLAEYRSDRHVLVFVEFVTDTRRVLDKSL